MILVVRPNIIAVAIIKPAVPLRSWSCRAQVSVAQITVQITVPVHNVALSTGAVDIISGADRTLLCSVTGTNGVRVCLNKQNVDLAGTFFSITENLNVQSALAFGGATIGIAQLTSKDKMLGTMEVTFSVVPMANVAGVTLMCSDGRQANQSVDLTAWLIGRYLYYIVYPSSVNVPLLSMCPCCAF